MRARSNSVWSQPAGGLHGKIVTAEEMQSIDARTIKDFGLSGEILMESAGRCVVDAIGRNWPEARKIIVLCGPGNNGGDGFVIARTWANRGGQAEVVLVASAENYQGDAAVQLQRVRACGIDPRDLTTHPDWTRCDLVVDAIFGTGLKRPVEGSIARLLEQVEASGKPIVAVDIPTGVDATRGSRLGRAVAADLTVTFGLPKLGHFLEPGASLRGRLEIHDIGLPLQYLTSSELKGELVNRTELATLLPVRSSTGHKGKFGRILLVVGSQKYPGAAVLSGRAALRAGAGMVFTVSPQEIAPIILGHNPETIVVARPEAPNKSFWNDELKDKKAVCVGPGLGPDTTKWVRQLLEHDLPPTVVDADALLALPEMRIPASARWILTPHHGEAARLLDCPVSQIEEDRLGSALEIARRFKAVTVLKGGPTLIAAPGGHYWVNISGGPVLSQAGTGDVLSGLLTALLGQGLQPTQAARLGVYMHGRAGDLRQGSSSRGLTAHEVADAIPMVADELHDSIHK